MKKPDTKKCVCCGKMKELSSELRKNDLTMWLFVACSFFFGVICGFILSPKRSFSIGCNNTAIGSNDDDDEDDE